ncbi:hypothetical protein [Bradyrhizobium sp. CCBAU 51627]|uniref:hypothetical protein n=1 Tax=Bradyrhizobium sp. CCBAU 51627 TaxID=1325088 RepID=UPI002305E5BF|nr:hypothetical protein [Bradyrhizobium sp. CCBAU 51627]MDA9437243.1 hypothetical protein [Bradyrhizobium sp. CCBAU 51627]
MSDYKEYSCASIKRFDFSSLPPGVFELKGGKIVCLEEHSSEVDAAGDKFVEALKRLAEEP